MIPGNLDDDEGDESRADASGEIRLPATLESSGPVPPKAEIVIVGGGVIGLAIAYYLARRGLTDVVVLERGYLAEGASLGLREKLVLADPHERLLRMNQDHRFAGCRVHDCARLLGRIDPALSPLELERDVLNLPSVVDGLFDHVIGSHGGGQGKHNVRDKE